jgi:aminopeptidase N
LHDIETSISRTAAASGNEQALQSWNQARTAYADWAQTFDNDYIRPLRNTTNRDYAKTFKSALDPDEFNVLTHVLDLSPQGQNLNQLVMKEVVNKNLEKYYIDPRKSVGSRDFKETLRELSSVVPEEGISRIKDFFSNASRRPAIRAKAPEKAISKETPAVQKASRFLEKGESEIINSLKTIEGMRDLGKELKATEAGAKNFETLQKHKLRSILQEGNIKKNFKGDDLARTLTKENNYEFVEEILGKEETAALLEAAEKTGNQQLKIESLKKIGKNALSYKALKFIIPLLP